MVAAAMPLSRVDREKLGASVLPDRAEGEMRHGFRISVGADPGGVEKVNAAFAGFAQTHALPEAVRRSLSVVLDELLANEISHGIAGRDARLLTVEVELDDYRLAVTLTDDGPPFDPFSYAAPDTTLSVDERQIGGLGIHLVRELMDEVSYQRRAGHNVVVLVKHLAVRQG
jgi:anti-sigma regulatory factor (Ser/Thr protein kinase)